MTNLEGVHVDVPGHEYSQLLDAQSPGVGNGGRGGGLCKAVFLLGLLISLTLGGLALLAPEIFARLVASPLGEPARIVTGLIDPRSALGAGHGALDDLKAGDVITVTPRMIAELRQLRSAAARSG